METCVNWGGPIAMVPCFHQGNVYIKTIEAKGMESPEMYPTPWCRNPHTCAGLPTTMSYGLRYRAENENLRKLGWTCRHGTVFAPKKYAYPNEAMDMESPEM